jgi:hypothetical protein
MRWLRAPWPVLVCACPSPQFIRDCWAPALQPALALTGHIAPSSSLENEKQNIPTSDPFARPFDLSCAPNPQPTPTNQYPCPYTTIGMGITITHSVAKPPITLTVDVQNH